MESVFEPQMFLFGSRLITSSPHRPRMETSNKTGSKEYMLCISRALRLALATCSSDVKLDMNTFSTECNHIPIYDVRITFWHHHIDNWNKKQVRSYSSDREKESSIQNQNDVKESVLKIEEIQKIR
ncbi:hypothetical protein AVEN_60360-1 [Araneus ventricosus]|uniref:Uncharacterized protein n=1 Tax=Araneus ventricosus TaxID=182803 RepID=A0A4Y2NRW9_ARAVE|nr:hypothetical protein AVEN_60360-1 [Araneus ventricosus]